MKITENGRLNCQVSEADGCGRGVGLIDPIPSKSIAISYSSGTGVTNGYVSVFSDARHSAGDHMPALVGITNIKDDLSDYLVPDTPNVWTVCMCGAGIEQYDSGNTANDSLTLPVAVPIVNKAGAATLYPRTLVAWRLPNTGINNNTSNDIIGGEFIYRLNNTNWGRAVDTALPATGLQTAGGALLTPACSWMGVGGTGGCNSGYSSVGLLPEWSRRFAAHRDEIRVTGGALNPSLIRAKAKWMRACRYVFEEQSSMKAAALLGRKYLMDRTAGSAIPLPADSPFEAEAH